MTDETTNPTPEVVDTAPAPALAPELVDELDVDLTDEVLSDEDEGTDEDWDEVEYEGKQYKVPKDLKDAVLRQADYTRKTQEVAEQRRALEAQQVQFQQAAQIQAQLQQEYAQVATLQSRLAQYEGVDWTRFSEDDPVAAQKAFFEYTKLKDAVIGAQSQLQQRQHALVEEHRAYRDKLIQEGRQALARDIKGWSPELGEELVKYATSQGIGEVEVRSTVSPAHLKILNKARLYDQLMAKASAKSKPVAPQAEPAPTVQGRSVSTVNPSRMSTDEWMRWRNKQVAKR
jgi:hypothetical protein